MGIFEVIVGIVCVIIIFMIGFAAGMGCRIGEYYTELTELVKKTNKLADPTIDFYQKLLKDYENLM